ncbi:MAG: glycosyltransferase family 2 protein [Elainellaceae cyanobacterium]
MNPTPSLVSVIIPAYNASQFLAETIDSVLAQTYSHFELLVIDDGSTDTTAEIVDAYRQRDQRVSRVSQTNGGVSRARNRGVDASNGELIAFLDSDDRWLPHKLATQVEWMNAHLDIAVCFCRARFMRFDSTPTDQLSNGRLAHIKPEHLLYENPTTTTSTWMVRREIFQKFGGFDPEMNYSEDIDYLLRIMLIGQQRIEGINDVLVYYRTNDGGLSSDLYRMEDGWNCMLEKAKQYDAELVHQHYSIAKAVHLRYFARRAIRLKLHPEVGKQYINRAFKADWRIILKEPRRTVLTCLAVYGLGLLTRKSAFKAT